MMHKYHSRAASRAAQRKELLPVVRAIHQFGPQPKEGPLRLFLDDARNPPLCEKEWIVVRNVEDATNFMMDHGDRVVEISVDNDLNEESQGCDFLQWILKNESIFSNLKKISIHTGNDPKARFMRELLIGYKYKVKRIIPSDRLYPDKKLDKRIVRPFRKKTKCGASNIDTT